MNISQSILNGLIDSPELFNNYGLSLPQISKFMGRPLVFPDRKQQAVLMVEDILAAHGKETLLEHISQLATIESGVRELQPKARDHVTHALLTFILGAYINEHFFNAASKADHFQWKLAALMHDIAYPIEIAQRRVIRPYENRINRIRNELGVSGNQIRFLIVPENLERLSNNVAGFDLIQRRIDDWDLAINAENAYRETIISGSVCHGMLSGLTLLYVLDLMYQKYNPARTYTNTSISQSKTNWSQRYFEEDIVSACTAVFIHNLEAKHFGSAKISRTKAPLAFLLRLSDSLQDWERPSMAAPEGTPADRYDIHVKGSQLVFVCDIPDDRIQKINTEIHEALEANDIVICRE